MKRSSNLFDIHSAVIASAAKRSRAVGRPLYRFVAALLAMRNACCKGHPMRFVAMVLLACCSLATPLRAEPQAFDQLRRADGARVVPEKFLRSFDPITVFFDRDAGPKAGGPEDAHEKFVKLSPEPAGEWRWIGARALQFRPAEPWKPLERVGVEAAGAATRLVALLPTPSSTEPGESAEPLADLERITLTFPEPVDLAALSRLLTIELRPAPGVSPLGGQMLTVRDYDIRALERADRGAGQSVAIRLREPVRDGRVAILRLKLADEPGLDDETFELRARSAAPFAVTEASCGRGWSDEKQDGVLRCAFGYSLAGSASSASEGEEENAAPAYQPANRRRLTLTFTEQPDAIDILRAREALRVTPPVDDLAVEIDHKRLEIYGKFLSDRVYELVVAPGALRDIRKRALAARFSQRFAFDRDRPALAWDTAQGIVERFGPQLLPLRGRGYDRADIRIHAIDPLARDFWPFPKAGVETEDSAPPPLPGNEPARWSDNAAPEASAIAERIKALGSPAVSALLDLPIRRNGADAKFGLDLSGEFAKIAGAEQPGTYLVGLRAVDDKKRHWLRAQLTDLTLGAIEERARVRFAVTSLSTAKPIAGAEIRLEGVKDEKFVTLAHGVTDASGFFSYDPGKRAEAELRRVVVSKGLDTLVIDANDAPSEYSRENWTKPDGAWLAWTTEPDTPRKEEPRILCHVFAERPIYRPEEPVHVKGFVRAYRDGGLSVAKTGGTLVVSGPGNQEWRIPVKLDAAGSFYHKFDAQTPATGDYALRFEPDGAKAKKTEESEGEESETAAPQTVSCGQFPFKKEAYRLPTFEVVLNAPQIVPLDGEFNVDLLARYFAGGLVAERPVKWRAVQFPHLFQPPGREGFLFSTDARFSGEGKFKSSPVLERDARTDAGGASRMSFDTTIEPTAQPRRYSIEATVTGEDGLEVRNVQNVIAVPPFMLGLKIPRYVERPGAVTPEFIALDGKGEAVENLPVTLRFVRRNWVSTLQASDFAQGAAKYVTQVIEDTILERKLTSAKEAQRIELEAREAGVYVVQLEAYDRIGRRQQVSVDFFVGGNTPVTFQRPPASTATIATDKQAYAPGETATLIIQSPFQNAQALAIVEQPNGVFDYQFVDIANGFGRYALTLKKEQTPKLAVHFLIMRGRLKDSAPAPASNIDQGKPVTIAATKWVEVTPVKNIATVKLDYPAKARPGQEVEATLRLSDDLGKPLAGEATFWMVDQAVLSLAKERPLDPLPDFIVERETRLAARDTRNLAFGKIPLEEIPGGDAGLDEWGAETNVSVRKNFTPVPIYLPSVKIGADGIAKIKVKLPDTLTVFKLRAKAVSGPDRFGFATGEMLIRQELVAQPALPRFLRRGDAVDVSLIARVVEGPGGGGKAAITADGLALASDAPHAFAWVANKPARIDVAATVPESGKETATLDFRVERDADHARDAVQIELPIEPDRLPVRRYEIVEIAPGETKTFPAAPDDARPGSFRREMTLAGDPALVKLMAGLNALAEYPYGCTEQRLSLARASLALKSFAPILSSAGLEGRIGADVRNTIRAIDQSIDGDGLVAFWPRARGNVSLTAWAYSFLAAAERAGEPIDKPLAERLANVLKLSLRSDYPRLLSGEELRERVEALIALAEGGKLDESYVAELARHADAMPNASVAELARAAARASAGDRRIVDALLDIMWSRVKILSRNGVQYYAGQAADAGNPTILPSETRALAEMVRATALAAPTDARAGLLRDALLRLGEGDGWGSTNADAAAIDALADVWRRPQSPLAIALAQGDAAPETITLDANMPILRKTSEAPAAIAIANRGQAPIVALVETRYEPKESGATAAPLSEGFALTRELLRVRKADAPLERIAADDGAVKLAVGDVIEETAELVNPQDRTHVAISLPLPAGFEPLNPALATAPAEAQPSFAPTLAPTSVSFGDDRVFYAYDALPKGNYRFAFRAKAQTAGVFSEPPGLVETMYKKGVRAQSAGRRVVIAN
ncbi:MG2 domain-containing protein [Methylosinus sp. Sm6]|uniref:alpha-2-macroglobulin n=1 Tax=Methylosinus sp. Sm6 TaxID=2866948 RepID=UPI001C9943F1|nr:MG2 domain-containing protein [Methylosinus sp. Sm6]MBY6241765.1 alpha-2-macroglobulin [Methylosinus sp. Sm6]